MKVEVWGSSIAALYLALRLHQSGINISYFRQSHDARLNRLRPARMGKNAVELIRDLQSARMRPFHIWSGSHSLKSWRYADALEFSPLGISAGYEKDLRIAPKLLFEELESIAKIAGLKIENEPVGAFEERDFQKTKTLQVLDAEPEALEKYRGKYFPERLRRPALHCRQWKFSAATESLDGGIAEFHTFAGARGIWESHSGKQNFLTLFAASTYALERAELALSEPRGNAPMAWKASFLNFHKESTLEGTLSLGPSHFEIPGVFLLGRGVGSFRPWSNLDIDFEICQSERLFRTLYHFAELQGPGLVAQEWNSRERAKFLWAFRRAEFSEDLFYSRRMGNLLSSASIFLPQALRQYLNVPV